LINTRNNGKSVVSQLKRVSPSDNKDDHECGEGVRPRHVVVERGCKAGGSQRVTANTMYITGADGWQWNVYQWGALQNYICKCCSVNLFTLHTNTTISPM